jgi:hypothetical protein
VTREDTDALVEEGTVPTVTEVDGNTLAVLEDFAFGKVTIVIIGAEDDAVGSELLETFGSGKVATVGGGKSRVDVKLDDLEAGVAKIGEV